MTPARPLAASVAALGITGVFAVPAVPAAAVPRTCERYAAQSGAELLRLNSRTPQPVGEARTVLSADAAPHSAAGSRMLNGSEPLLRTAPSGKARSGRRDMPAASAGPLRLDAGTLTAQARWAPGMGCGVTDGEVSRAEVTMGAVRVGSGALMAVPGKGASLSTTALEGHGSDAHVVASTTVSARTVELLGGAVTIRMMRPPRLEARMSTSDGGEVVYLPARLEVSGDGIESAELDTAGDRVEFTVGEGRRTGPLEVGGSAEPMPMPTVSGLPWPRTPGRELGPSGFSGTHVRISLGDVRQAARGHSIAARVEAVTVVVTEDQITPGYGVKPADAILDLDIGVLESAAVSPEVGGGVASPMPSASPSPDGDGGPGTESPGVERRGAGSTDGDQSSAGPSNGDRPGWRPSNDDRSGAGPADGDRAGARSRGAERRGARSEDGELPVTGPRVDLVVLSGLALLVGGAAAMIFGFSRRRRA